VRSGRAQVRLGLRQPVAQPPSNRPCPCRGLVGRAVEDGVAGGGSCVPGGLDRPSPAQTRSRAQGSGPGYPGRRHLEHLCGNLRDSASDARPVPGFARSEPSSSMRELTARGFRPEMEDPVNRNSQGNPVCPARHPVPRRSRAPRWRLTPSWGRSQPSRERTPLAGIQRTLEGYSPNRPGYPYRCYDCASRRTEGIFEEFGIP